MKVLIVEDEAKTGDYVKQGLIEADFNVDLAQDGQDGLQLAMGEPYDLIVLDVMLPNLDGWQVLQLLRRAGKSMPILMLTAVSDGNSQHKGLALGANDYLVKPFSFAELLARIRLLLHPGSASGHGAVLRLANLELDLLRRRAIRAGTRIDLTAKEFALLELLLRQHGQVLPRSLIATKVWGMDFDGDRNVIEVAVRRLRTKIDDGFTPKLIHTVRGIGYLLDSQPSE